MKEFIFRQPIIDDAKNIHELAQPFKPLIGTNPIYTYLLITTHFSETSIVAIDPDSQQLAGFVSGYITPNHSDKTLFLWEIGVKHGFHGHNLYIRMVNTLIAKIQPTFVEATVGPSNASSSNRLHDISNAFNAPLNTSTQFHEHHFGALNHEKEILYSIGPISTDFYLK